jgi:pimeloyl-ACP methyl ester carboxylesterase
VQRLSSKLVSILANSVHSERDAPNPALESVQKTVHVERTGPDDAPAIVLVHGWGSSAELMRPIARVVENEHRVINIDLPGHGLTPPPPFALGVVDFAEVVAAILREQQVASCTLVGHSNGGRIGLFMASDARYAPYIKRLVLISPSGIRRLRSMRTRLKAHAASLLKAPFSLLPRRLRERGLAWLRDSAIWRRLGSSDYRTLDGPMRETFVRTVNTYLEDAVERVTVPTLIFRGTQDSDVTYRQVRILVDRIPDCGLVELREAGHFGYLDDPATFNAALRHFLRHT